MSAKVWTDERLLALAERAASGETLASIARQHGVSSERIRQLIFKAERIQRRNQRLAEGWTIVNGGWVAPDEAERLKAQS